MSKKQKLTGNKQIVTSNEQKITSNKWQKNVLIYVLFMSYIGRDVVGYAKMSSRRRDWYVNEMDLFETY